MIDELIVLNDPNDIATTQKILKNLHEKGVSIVTYDTTNVTLAMVPIGKIAIGDDGTSTRIFLRSGENNLVTVGGTDAETLDGYDTTTSVSASSVPILDSDGYISVFLQTYNSGWIQLAANATTATLTHNLGDAAVFNLQYSGPSIFMCVYNGYTDYGSQIIELSSTTLAVSSGAQGVGMKVLGGEVNYVTGCVRVLGLALA